MSYPTSRSSSPSMVDSDLVQRTKTEIDEQDHPNLTKDLIEAMEERKSQHPGLYTEGPEYYDPYGTAPAYKKKLTEQEMAREERIMQEWKAKPEREPRRRPNPQGYFTTEAAMENGLLDQIDGIFKPTLALPHAPASIRVELLEQNKEIPHEKEESDPGYHSLEGYDRPGQSPQGNQLKRNNPLDESRQ